MDVPKDIEEKLKGKDLNRTPVAKPHQEAQKQKSVSEGPVDKLIDLGYNPTRDKIREVTVIDRIQGRLFPLIDLTLMGRTHILQVAEYRMDPEAYGLAHPEEQRPVQPNLLEEYLYRVSQWQKSVQGMNLKSLNDAIITEMETKAVEDEDTYGGNRDAWADKD